MTVGKVTKAHLLERIEELEARAAELEAAPKQWTPPPYIHQPWWQVPVKPLEIWCSTTIDYAADNPYGYL